MSQSISPFGLFGRKVLSPSALAQKLQDSFDRDFGQVWVEGEIGELALPYSGHAYFSLKDAQAKLKAVMWKGRRAYAGSVLVDGLAVLARGRLSVYAPRGEYQLVVDYLEPLGEGALKLAYEKLKKKLEEEGFFDPAGKRALPYWPRRVALISSPAGAAPRDFIRTALKLNPGAHISLYPVRVQGQGAAAEIVKALADLNAWGGFDVIVLTRGGGSLSDLWTFNEEEVVRAVAASRLPTLAAVGHSTDLTLTELAADRRAITPTAAAREIFRDRDEMLNWLEAMSRRFLAGLTTDLEFRKARLSEMERRLGRRAGDFLESLGFRLERALMRLSCFERQVARDRQRLDLLSLDLNRVLKSALERSRERLKAAERAVRYFPPRRLAAQIAIDLNRLEVRLERALRATLDRRRENLNVLNQKCVLLSPLKILDRGYALVTKGPGGAVVTSSRETSVDEDLSIMLALGSLGVRVKEVR